MGTGSKTAPTITSVSAFLATIEPESRNAEAQALLKLFETSTGVKGQMWGPSIVGFGTYNYEYESGRKGEAPCVAYSPRKAQLVIYGLGLANISAETFNRLGKHALGKGCLYIKKLADIDQSILSSLITTAWLNSQGQESTIS